MQEFRDLAHSGLTVLAAPFMYYTFIKEIKEPSKLTFAKISLALVVELAKVVLVHVACQYSKKIPYNRSKLQGNLSGFDNETSFSFSKKGRLSTFIGLASSYLASVIVCHLMLILFGAPIFEKWDLTLGFSVALVSWLFFPLTFTMRSSSMLKEFLLLSSVDPKHATRTRAKWSVIMTVFGAWAGAIFIPLDWDRPWQQWPVPCMVTSFICYSLVHLFFCAKVVFHNLLN